MKNLNPPELDPIDLYSSLLKNARSEEKKIRMIELQPYLVRRYDFYKEISSNLENMTISEITDTNDISILHSCYNRNRKGHLEGEIVAKIINIQSIQHKNKCPYCGIDRPRTIDHYLPKSDFPEFSVFPLNLVPCCQYCNGKKGDRWINESGKRIFLNLYYDKIPEIKYLYTRIHLDQAGLPIIKFELVYTEEIECFDIIKEHYAALDLLNQYSLNVEDEISSIHDYLVHGEIPIETHIEALQVTLDSTIRRYGINYWKSSFLDSLLRCSEFFEKYRSRVTTM
ncbi:HNH endonuclease [Paenibacillus sp. HB172176]|uniref:HNH endonuclease n=1 Tax=Paenibacillus sp. HB172176 TaxID=2493690 RepID=UPI00143A1BC6|nr:HNH endonuclease [Paenibacillus sp. HB172176]